MRIVFAIARWLVTSAVDRNQAVITL